MSSEVLEFLAPVSGKNYLDATFGGGGHSQLLLEHSAPEGKVWGIDRDLAVERFARVLKEEYPKRFFFEPISFSDIGSLGQRFDGIIFDLGLSSDQLASEGRGFSFQTNEPLDMRFDQRRGITAAQLLSTSSMPTLERIFREYGEDRRPGTLARKIVERRRSQPIKTTFQLVEVVGTSQPKVLAPIFQAIRIAVNDELETLRHGLKAATESLNKNGVLAVISFHSIEDRIAKQFLRDSNLEILTKKPFPASEEEARANPRARSAKLRAAKRTN